MKTLVKCSVEGHVSNTSLITNLAGIGKLDLLHQLYGTVTIPQAVYNEMACGIHITDVLGLLLEARQGLIVAVQP